VLDARTYSLDELTHESHRTGTTLAAENAYRAETTLGILKYLVNNYNLYIDAINLRNGGRLPHKRLVDET
jgi:hypothetical protein